MCDSQNIPTGTTSQVCLCLKILCTPLYSPPLTPITPLPPRGNTYAVVCPSCLVCVLPVLCVLVLPYPVIVPCLPICSSSSLLLPSFFMSPSMLLLSLLHTRAIFLPFPSSLFVFSLFSPSSIPSSLSSSFLLSLSHLLISFFYPPHLIISSSYFLSFLLFVFSHCSHLSSSLSVSSTSPPPPPPPCVPLSLLHSPNPFLSFSIFSLIPEAKVNPFPPLFLPSPPAS